MKLNYVLYLYLFSLTSCAAQQEQVFESHYNVVIDKPILEEVKFYAYKKDANPIIPKPEVELPKTIRQQFRGEAVLRAYLSAQSKEDLAKIYCSDCTLPDIDFKWLSHLSPRGDKFEILHSVNYTIDDMQYLSIKFKRYNPQGILLGIGGVLLKDVNNYWIIWNKNIPSNVAEYHEFFIKLKSEIGEELLGKKSSRKPRVVSSDIKDDTIRYVIEKSRYGNNFTYSYFNELTSDLSAKHLNQLFDNSIKINAL